MSIVELDKIRGALVGVPGDSGLSVGQRKRLSIGVEMSASPSCLFLDEPGRALSPKPTSGAGFRLRHCAISPKHKPKL